MRILTQRNCYFVSQKTAIILVRLIEQLFGTRSQETGKVELISLHIPKTAGTSFRHFLKRIYGDRAVIRLDIPLLSPILRINEVKQADDAQLPKGTKVVHGHFNLTELRKRFPELAETPAITWLRHPVERVISNYFYLAKRLAEELDEEGKDLNILSKMQRSLLEYAKDEINRNRQHKFLAGTPLEDFAFVGIQAHYDAEVAAMIKTFGWPQQLAPKLNITGGKKREIEPEVFNQIAALNAEDMALYERGLQLRRERNQIAQLDLVSIHIPKTGGTSFYKILKGQYDEAVSTSLRRVDVQSALKHYGGLIEHLDPKTKVLHGHFHYKELELGPKEDTKQPKIITFLRHPVDRVISNYRFFKAGLEQPERNPENYKLNKHRIGEDLLTYASRLENQNVMCKFLDGISLNDLFFVGLLEHFEQDIHELTELMGWTKIDIPKLNQGTQQAEVDEALRAQIAALNTKDIDLYKKAKKIRGLI